MRTILQCVVVALIFGSTTEVLCQPASKLTGADGELIFSRAFLDDERAAMTRAGDVKSVEPLLALLNKYSKPEEIAELELAIGMHYNQRTGMVDHAQAVTHLTRALLYQLPEQVWLQATVWRSSSLLRLERHAEAMRDALRVLVAASYRDMSQACPPIESPTRPAVITGRGNNSPESIQRGQDYNRYRDQIDVLRSLSVLKYHSVDLVKRIQSSTQMSDNDVRTALLEISPDRSRPDIVFNWLKSPNVFPSCSR